MKAMPRVLVLTSTFPRWPGDTTPRFVHDLACAASDAFEVTVMAPHHPGARSRERMGPLDVRRFVYFVPTRLERLCYDGGILPKLASSPLARAQLPAFLAAELTAVLRLLRAEHFDLVHAHWLVPQGIVAALATAGIRRPLVVSAHGSDVFALRGPVFDALRRWVGRRADAITVNSAATRDEVVRALPGSRPHLVPMGLDDALLRADGATDARRDGPLLFVGRLSHQKRVDVLLEALAAPSDVRPRPRLDVVGDGPLRSSLERRAAELGLGDRVSFLGARPHEEVVDRLRRARAFVCPARSEGQGLAVLEAMACGCPVVAAESGALRELLGDGARGVGVRGDDAAALARGIARVLGDPELAQRRALAARAFVAEGYTWRVLAPRLNEVYREALARASSWA
jgi:glycosyltransferase involved in cell wall biosynthesis